MSTFEFCAITNGGKVKNAFKTKPNQNKMLQHTINVTKYLNISQLPASICSKVFKTHLSQHAVITIRTIRSLINSFIFSKDKFYCTFKMYETLLLLLLLCLFHFYAHTWLKCFVSIFLLCLQIQSTHLANPVRMN